MAKRTTHCSLGGKLEGDRAHHAAHLSPRCTIGSFSRPCSNGWIPFTRVHLGQRAGRPTQGRSQNTQRQKRRAADAGTRTTAPRKTSTPTATERTLLLGWPHVGAFSFQRFSSQLRHAAHDRFAKTRPDRSTQSVFAPFGRANRHQAIQSLCRRKGTRYRVVCSRDAAPDDWERTKVRTRRNAPCPRTTRAATSG